MNLEIKVPDIGDFKNVEIIEVLIKEGDRIKKNDPILTLESDKSSVEVPSPFDGNISSVKVKVGDKVSKGSLIATLTNDNIKNITINNDDKSILPETEKIIQEAEKTLKKTSSSQEVKKEESKRSFETKIEYKKFWILNNSMIENRIFATATPFESMIINTHIYGNCIEKIKVHELMNMKILFILDQQFNN